MCEIALRPAPRMFMVPKFGLYVEKRSLSTNRTFMESIPHSPFLPTPLPWVAALVVHLQCLKRGFCSFFLHHPCEYTLQLCSQLMHGPSELLNMQAWLFLTRPISHYIATDDGKLRAPCWSLSVEGTRTEKKQRHERWKQELLPTKNYWLSRKNRVPDLKDKTETCLTTERADVWMSVKFGKFQAGDPVRPRQYE